MAIDYTKAFNANNGFFIDEGTGVFISGGDSVPTFNAPEGSKYFRTEGTQYTQNGSGITNTWVAGAANTSAGLSCLAFIRQGSAGNNWLEYEHSTGSESDVVPAVLPFDFTAKSIVFHNRISLSDPTIKIYRNMSFTTPILTWSLTDKIYGVKNSSLSALNSNQFDKLSVHIEGSGTNPDDVIFCIYGEFTNLNTTDDSGSTY